MGLWGDPEVTRLTSGPLTPAQVHTRLSEEIACHERYGFQYWPIFLLDSGEHVGCCGLQPREPDSNIYELGYQLRRSHWGQGFAREAAVAAATFAFTACQAKALFAGHHPSNDISRRILLAVGFHYTHHELYPPSQQMEPCYLLTRDALAVP